MAGFTRTKDYADGDTLTAADWTGELDNIIINLYPAMIDDESASATAMRATADPYPSSVASLATTLQGEIQRLRYILAQITGQTYWYEDTTYPEAIMQFDCGDGTIADSLTQYIGKSIVTGSITDVESRVPFKATVANLHTNTPGWSTGTATYTVQKNGVDTALTCATTGAGTQSSDVTHTVSFAIGDSIGVKVVTSGGAATLSHACTVSLKKVP